MSSFTSCATRARKRLFCLLAWPFTPHGFKTLLFSAACLATLIAAFYVIENWRGEKAWTRTKAELQAKGIPTTYDEILPPPPPDDQNFMMAPFWVERWNEESHRHDKIPTKIAEDLYAKAAGMNMEAWRKSKNYEMPPHPMSFLGDWQTQRFSNLEALREYFVAAGHLPESAAQEEASAAILRMTDAWSDDINALTEADRTRPVSYFPIDWRKGYFFSQPLWEISIRTTKNLRIRAQCALESGDEREALTCLHLIDRLTEVQLAPPSSLVGVLLSASQEMLLLPGIWHGLARHQWSEASLQQLEDMLAQRDYRAAWQRAMRLEQVAFLQTIDALCAAEVESSKEIHHWLSTADHKEALKSLGFRAEVFRYFPRGWWRRNQVTYTRLQKPFLERELPWSELVKINEDERVKALPASPYAVFVKLVTPAFHNAKVNTVTAVASISLARLAIAAERHRLRTSSYPESLEDLQEYFPGRLPLDPFVDQPFGYRLADGIPTFWSVGQNLKDEGGTVVINGAIPGQQRLDRSQGDIVWTYPAPAEHHQSR